jgi:hypothetical protein
MRGFHRGVAASLLMWLGAFSNSAQLSLTRPAPQSYVVSGTVSETVDGVSNVDVMPDRRVVVIVTALSKSGFGRSACRLQARLNE